MTVGRKSEAAIVGIIRARDTKLHISSLMLLRICDHLTMSDDRPNIGEVHGFYRAQRKETKGAINYTYSGVATMLRKLHVQGYLHRFRESRYVTYSLTKKGEETLDAMYF